MEWWEDIKKRMGWRSHAPELPEQVTIAPAQPEEPQKTDYIARDTAEHEGLEEFSASLKEQVDAYKETLEAYSDDREIDGYFRTGGMDWQLEARQAHDTAIDNNEIPRDSLLNPYVRGLDNVNAAYIEAYTQQAYDHSIQVYKREGVLAFHHEIGEVLLPQPEEAIPYLDLRFERLDGDHQGAVPFFKKPDDGSHQVEITAAEMMGMENMDAITERRHSQDFKMAKNSVLNHAPELPPSGIEDAFTKTQDQVADPVLPPHEAFKAARAEQEAEGGEPEQQDQEKAEEIAPPEEEQEQEQQPQPEQDKTEEVEAEERAEDSPERDSEGGAAEDTDNKQETKDYKNNVTDKSLESPDHGQEHTDRIQGEKAKQQDGEEDGQEIQAPKRPRGRSR